MIHPDERVTRTEPSSRSASRSSPSDSRSRSSGSTFLTLGVVSLTLGLVTDHEDAVPPEPGDDAGDGA
jgi:hypothetical protein